jgi:hypothetical protein
MGEIGRRFKIIVSTIKPEVNVWLMPIGLTSEDTRWKQFQWNTNVYSSADSKDDEDVNAAWDRIVPAFGIVAVDREWAAERELPGSMSLPSDASKGVYIIDA